jgi:hypothetical protein
VLLAAIALLGHRFVLNVMQEDIFMTMQFISINIVKKTSVCYAPPGRFRWRVLVNVLFVLLESTLKTTKLIPRLMIIQTIVSHAALANGHLMDPITASRV